MKSHPARNPSAVPPITSPQAGNAVPTRCPRQALAWLQSGRPIRIAALNLRDHLRHVRALATLQAQGGAL